MDIKYKEGPLKQEYQDSEMREWSSLKKEKCSATKA
jgi:hypothetical protein